MKHLLFFGRDNFNSGRFLRSNDVVFSLEASPVSSATDMRAVVSTSRSLAACTYIPMRELC